MNNELLIIKKRNFTALWLFVIIIVFSFPLSQQPTLINQSLIFHFTQYIVVLVVFKKQLRPTSLAKIEEIQMVQALLLLFQGLVYFFCVPRILENLIDYSILSQQYFGDDKLDYYIFLFSRISIIPISYIFVSEFIIGKNLFDEKKHRERRNVIIKLKERGSISESDFTLKMNDLNELKIKTEVVLSNDYRKLKRELKKGNISQKEMDDYVLNEIRKMNNMNQ